MFNVYNNIIRDIIINVKSHNICVNKYAEDGPEYKQFYPQTETGQIVDFDTETKRIIDERVGNYTYGSNGTIKALGGVLTEVKIDPLDNEPINIYIIDVDKSLEDYKDIYEPLISKASIKK